MTKALTTFGYELEYASGALGVAEVLARSGLLGEPQLHRYHCGCESCSTMDPVDRRYELIDANDGVCPEYDGDDEDGPRGAVSEMFTDNRLRDLRWRAGTRLLHAQTDSTADGEFVTNILDDWGEFSLITNMLTKAANDVGARPGNRCGLHVHVSPGRIGVNPSQVALAYLAYERYFVEVMAPGASNHKRDMNQTLMEALRQSVTDRYFSGNEFVGDGPEAWKSVGLSTARWMAAQVIGRDRHVDLNINHNYGTVEFRTFNSTNAPWRIELACRLAVAFVAATDELVTEVSRAVRGSRYWPEDCDSPWGEIVRPAWSTRPAPRPTKKPVVEFARFLEILSGCDPALMPLIERQAVYMRSRFAREVPAAVPQDAETPDEGDIDPSAPPLSEFQLAY